MKLCNCRRAYEVPNFSSKAKRKTCTQCLDCGMYTFPCPDGHDVLMDYCINCGQFSPTLKLREDLQFSSGTDTPFIMTEPIVLNG